MERWKAEVAARWKGRWKEDGRKMEGCSGRVFGEKISLRAIE
jgi:hypothetical protein